MHRSIECEESIVKSNIVNNSWWDMFLIKRIIQNLPSIRHLCFSICLLCSLFCCIDEYIPQGMEEVRGILVVDGMIRNGESVFRLSYSAGTSDKLDGSQAINHAEVYVESNDGIRVSALFSGSGVYIAQTPVLDAEKEYRFSALIDGELCESEFLSPIITAEIDSIFPVKQGINEPVELCVATHDPDNSSMYYRWTYRETWEVKADLYANARWGPSGDVIFHNLHTSENTYYCWGRDSSKTFILASAEKLSENRITQQILTSFPCDHDKLSILYHIETEQMQLRESAYKYFANVNEQVERAGDIFSPILTTGLRGNIYFRGDPGRVVIGYIEVATVTSMDRYIWEREGFYKAPLRRCNPDNLSDIVWWDIRTFGYSPIYLYLEKMAVRSVCVDCRVKENASKLKPPGWLTEHL